MARSGQQLHPSLVLLFRAHCALHSTHGSSRLAAAHRPTYGGVPAYRCFSASHDSMSGADMDVTDTKTASNPQHHGGDPLAATRQLLLSLQLLDGHGQSRLAVAKRLIDIFQRAGLPVINHALAPAAATSAVLDPEAQASAAASAVARCVEEGLGMAASGQEQWRWVAAGVPELLQLHARLGAPQSPELGERLARLLAAGHLDGGSSSSSWTGNTASLGASPGAIAAAAARAGAGAGAAQRKGASAAGDTTRTAAGAVAEGCPGHTAGQQHYIQQLQQHQHHAPAILRWAAAMAALPVSNHEAWRLLASSPLLHHLQLNPHPHLHHQQQQQPPLSSRATVGSLARGPLQPSSDNSCLGPSAKPRVPPLLAGLTPDQLALLLSSYARAVYHPVEVLRFASSRLLPHVPQLPPGSLARALHALAALRHHDPGLLAALCEEAASRLSGRSGASGGGVAGGGGGSDGGGGLFGLGRLFGGGQGKGETDQAVGPRGAPPFLWQDLVRLAAAAHHLGLGLAAAGGQGPGAGAGAGAGEALGDRLLAAVMGDAVAAAEEQLRRLMAAGQGQGLQHPQAGLVEAEDGTFDEDGSDGVVAAKGKAVQRQPTATWPAHTVTELMDLLAALVAGGCASAASGGVSGTSGGGAGGGRRMHLTPPSRAALLLAADRLVPHLRAMEPHLNPHHLVTLLAALLPGGSAALVLSGHPHPGPPGSASGGAALYGIRQLRGALQHHTQSAPGGAAGNGALLQVVAALCRQASQDDPRVGGFGESTEGSTAAAAVLAAWQVLAAARAAGSPGADDQRLVARLLPRVAAAAEAHLGPGDAATAVQCTTFLVSCAHLGAVSGAALAAAADRLVELCTAVAAVEGGYGGGYAGGGAGGEGGGGGLAAALGVEGFAQLAWAVGHLGLKHESLLEQIQAETLELLDADPSPERVLGALERDPWVGRSRAERAFEAARGSGGAGGGSGKAVRGRVGSGVGGSAEGGGGFGAGAAGTAAGGGGGGMAGGRAQKLGPLELGEVMWCLLVTGHRTNGGAELREMYMRAATYPVVSIEDPRWLRLVQVHVAVLLGAAGSFGEAAAQLTQGWFNSLTYVWERQARDLAVPGRGSHPHADAFREAVTQCAKDLQRLPEEEQEQQEEQEATDMGQQQLGQGPEGQGQGAAEGGAAGANQAGPGAEMEGAGAGASSQAGGTAPAFGEVVGGSRVAARAGRGSGSGTAGAGAAGAARGRSGRSTARDWQLLTGLPWRLPPPSTEISLVLPLVAKHRGQGRWMVAFDLVARQDVATTWGTAVQRGTGVAVQQGPGTGAGAGAETGAGAGVGAGAGGEHLLGPARWRGLVLGQLGVLVRRVHETAWDRMSPAQRRALLREQLQLPPH